jgi:DNA-binding NtrC family response regulator
MRQDLILIEQSERNSGNWQTLARDMVRAQGSAPVILLAEGGSEELAVAAMRLGVRDYLPLPVSAPALNEALERCLGQTKHGRGTGEARQAPRNDNNDRDDAMVGESEVRWT